MYLTGETFASVLPTTVGTVQPAYGGGTCFAIGEIGGGSTSPCPDAFVIKLDPMGQLIYATYLGGGDEGSAIAADASGNAYVAGSGSSNFPTTPNAAFSKNGPGFITKLNPAGNQLLYSTLNPAPINGIALDPQGNVYLVGTTDPQGSPFPVTSGAFQTSSSKPGTTGVVAKLNPAGSALYTGLILEEAARTQPVESPSMPLETPS